jgi:ubiquinone/menaquinone biosynthesis C-methylase UbiE
MSQTASTPGPMQLPTAWDSVAPTYAEDVAQWHDFADEALRTVPLAPSDRVLDVATGPGTLAFAAASRAASVDAVDFSPGMIAELTRRATRERVKNIEGAIMDAQSLNFPDGTFDVAFCLFAFFFFPDRARAFGELYRVLRPSGRVLIATWAPIDRRPVMQIGMEAFAEAMPELPRPAKGDLQDPDECVREMSAAGFRDVAAHKFTASVRVESPRQYLDLITRSGAPCAIMRKKMGEAAWEAAMGRVLDVVRRRIPEGGAELSAEAIFTRGTR